MSENLEYPAGYGDFRRALEPLYSTDFICPRCGGQIVNGKCEDCSYREARN